MREDSIGLFELIHTLMEMYQEHGVIEVGFGTSLSYDRITRIEFVDGCRIKLIGEES